MAALNSDHYRQFHCTVSFPGLHLSLAEPALVLQATNAGVRRPGNEAGVSIRTLYRESCLILDTSPKNSLFASVGRLWKTFQKCLMVRCAGE